MGREVRCSWWTIWEAGVAVAAPFDWSRRIRQAGTPHEEAIARLSTGVV
ncbi:MAG: hypothetical protein ACKOYH_00915 [Cyanobium sp.]